MKKGGRAAVVAFHSVRNVGGGEEVVDRDGGSFATSAEKSLMVTPKVVF